MAKKSQSNTPKSPKVSKAPKASKSLKKPSKVPKKTVKKADLKVALNAGNSKASSSPIVAVTSAPLYESTVPVDDAGVSGVSGASDTLAKSDGAETIPSEETETLDAAEATVEALEFAQIAESSEFSDGIDGGTLSEATPTSYVTNTPRRRSKFGKKAVLVSVLLLLVVASLLWRAHAERSVPASEAATNQLIAEIADRAVLPKGEKPSVSTVVDKNKADQAFLVNASDGDKVLLYFQAGRAVLYRPSTHQIVNMGPLTQPPAQVFLRNGTSGDIPASIHTSLGKSAGFKVVSQDLSTRPTYADTLVIDITGNRPDLATRVAKLVGGKVVRLPSGEIAPDAEILVIVGADAK